MRKISSIQEPIWLTQQLYPQSSLYNVGGYACINGSINESLLLESIRQVLNNTDAINIGYEAFNEIALADNKEFILYDIATLDFSNKPNPIQACLDWMQEDIKEAFNVNQNLLKIRIFKAGRNKYYWFVKVHHLIFDGYAMSLFFNAVSALYSSKINNKKDADLTLYRYADFIEDEETYKHSNTHKLDKTFWIDKLKNVPENKGFQTCLRSTNTESFISKRKEIIISRTLYEQIENFCKEYHCTVFHYFIAALFTLNKVYNNEDITIGIAVFNRSNSRYKNTLGTFVNMLPFGISFTEDVSFIQLLQHVKNELKQCYRHQCFPLYDALKELDKKGNMYNVSFSYQKSTYQPKLGNVNASIYYLHNSEQQDDLSFNLLEYSSTEDLTLAIDYKENVFNECAIDGLINHYYTLIEHLYTIPQKVIKEIEYLTEREKYKLLVEFNDTAAEYPKDKTILDLFEEQVEKTPNNIAVVFEEKEFTYKELNEQSNQLAHYLQKNYKIKPDDFIGIQLERSEWMIVAILGVLKSGGAYVPIDPEYPQGRIDYMISDSSCKMIIDERELAKYKEEENKYGKRNIESINRFSDLAYVIYTSGSTGRPKGVMIEHHALVYYVLTASTVFGFQESDRVIQQSSLSFDTHIEEIFPTLINGARLLISKNGGKDVEELTTLIHQQKATILSTTPLVLRELHATCTSLNQLRILISGGDVFNTSYVSNYVGKILIYNTYGPTECTVCSTVTSISSDHINANIGHPITNKTVYILNDSNALQPIGVIGEICIGGKGIGRGYLHNAELTAAKFIQHPFKSNERIYKTGDMGRWLADGTIEFIGRKDDQVKIRGYRIELGEIENTLQNHPDVDAAVVIVKTNRQSEKELVTYLVSKKNLHAADLRTYLSGLIPIYMVPAYFIQLETLPITINGKIDKKRLPDPEGLNISSGVEYVAPSNKMEEKLVAIWQEILSKEKVSVLDNFFELGGHSLSATRLVSQIHKQCNVKLTLKDLFQWPTLEQQARLIEQTTTTKFSNISIAVKQNSYLLSSAQHRLWIISQFEEASIAYNMPGVYVFEGSVDKVALQQAFNTLIDRHEILRTVIKEDEKEKIKQWVLSVEELGFRIGYQDLRDVNKQAQKIKRLIQEEATKVFNFAMEPLLRANLYQIEEDQWIFTYTMHHIISDGWSMNIIIRELLILYNAYTKGEANPLLPLIIQYKDYAVWQQQQLHEPALQSHKQYWLQQFQGELPVLSLLTDKPRPAVKTYNGASVQKIIHTDLFKRLQTFNQQQGCTLFMSLVAAVNTLLYRYTQQEDIIIGSVVAGREHADLENQIGFYVNTIALRTLCKGKNSFQELVQNVKQTTLQAYEHQLFPFDELVDALQLKHDTSRNPLFDVMMVLQNTETDRTSIHQPINGLSIRNYEQENRLAKFDISFDFSEIQNQLHVHVEYNTDIYEEHTVVQLANHLESLLQAALQQPTTSIQSLKYLSHNEEALFKAFNKVEPYFSLNKNIVEHIEAKALSQPHKTAIQFNEQLINYGTLNGVANQLAHYLLEKHITGKDVLIGVMMHRSITMAESILGIWKTGSAYVPLDTDYPTERIQQMVEAGQIKALIVDQTVSVQQIELLQPHIPVIHIDEIRSYLKKLPTHNLNKTIDANDLAYVIYTSGSTGQPKGVMIEHLGMMNHIGAKIVEMQISEDSKVAQNAPHTFDISVWQLFAGLVAGGTTVIYSSEIILDPNRFIQQLHVDGITVLELVPSYFVEMLSVLEEQKDALTLSDLKILILNAETLMPSMVKRWLTLYPNIPIVNTYGATETSDDTSHYIMHSLPDTSTVPVMQKPIQHFEVHLVDEQLQRVPIGAIGEVLLCGIAVGRGYLNDEAKTKKSFLTGPLPGITESKRIYRTGDLARYLSDGRMEFLGRKDTQVKIRGHRIELGEIEHALMEIVEIENTTVLANVEEQYLAAYYQSEKELAREDIIELLKKKLPSYMLPHYYIRMEQFPLSANGKIDKKQLPKPETLGLSTGANYVAPTNETEKHVVAVYEEVLKKKPIGIKDDFFALGGDSIKSIQVVSRLKQRGLSITIRDILTSPVVKDLATKVKTNSRHIAQNIVEGLIPLSPVQQYFFEQHDVDNHHYNQSVLLQSKKTILEKDLKAALDKLVLHHDALRMVYKKIDNVWIQENKGETQGYHLEILDVQDEENFQAHCNRIQSSIDLQHGPLLKIALFKNPEQADRLLIVCHHLIIDGVSWRILLEDLSTLYQQSLLHQLLTLPLKTDSFQYWLQKQIEYANSNTLEKEENYWSTLSKQVIDLLSIDNTQGSNNVHDTAEETFIVDENTTQQLLTQSYKAYQTDINDVLITALTLAVHKTFNIKHIAITLEGHGREQIVDDIDISRTVGWFTSLYPVVINVQHHDTLIRHAIEVKETLHRIPNKGVGYGILRYLAKKTYAIQPQIIFNYLGNIEASVTNTEGHQMFEFLGEAHGREISPNRKRNHILDISGIIVDNQLRLSISYSSQQYNTSTIKRLVYAYQQQLTQLIQQLAAEPITHITPVDLTYKALTVDQVQKINKENNIEDIYPLTPLQEGLYYHWLSASDPSLYFDQMSFELKGNLQVELVEKTYKLLVDRHAVLRTYFTQAYAENILQIVQKQVYNNFTYLDVTAEKDFSTQVYRTKDRAKGFDLHNSSQIRLTVISLDKDTYEFIWSFHHILMDGWCLSILVKEFFEIYNSLITNKSFQLNKVYPYSNYIKWLTKIDKEYSLNYWKDYLLGYHKLSTIPQLSIKKQKQEDQHKELSFTLNASIRKSVRTLCNTLAVTENTFIQTAWGILLGKYNNTEDVVFGAVVSGRPSEIEGIEEMIGLFINTIPVRISIRNVIPIKELLKEVQQSFILGNPHHYVQLAEIQSQSEITKGLFDHILIFENYPIQDRMQQILKGKNIAEGLALLSYEVFERINYDFSIFVLPNEQDITIKFCYNSNLYDEVVIKQLQNHLLKIIEQIIENPTIAVQGIDYLSEKEKHQLLVKFNDTAVGYPKDKTVVNLFEEQVQETPNGIAVVCGEKEFTYKEMDEQSNQLSNFLIKDLKLLNESRVGILQTRNKELIISILGILKAGGVYIPLDSQYPEDRLLYMIEDADIEIVLVDKLLVELANRLQWRSKKLKHLVCINSSDIYREQGGFKNELMSKDLWDHVGDTTTDAISGGGWMSSYTGEYLSEAEMKEYSENAYLKLKEYLHPQMKVLEIGCSSGLTMFQIAPKVGKYYGTDLSSSILSNTSKIIKEKGYNNIVLTCLSAHEIDQLDEKEFDLVIINSVIQYFNGYNYLREVLIKVIDRIKDQGILFVGDVMDEDKRKMLIEDLTVFKEINIGKNYRTKTDWSSELFVSKEYFTDLIIDNIGIVKVDYLDRAYTISNELNQYQYDVLLHVDKRLKQLESKKLEKKKYQYDIKKINAHNTTAANVPIKTNNLAYIIYTSGSTGQPKGVMIEHQNVVSLLENFNSQFLLEKDMVFGAITSCTFDISVLELLGTLIHGIKLILISKTDSANIVKAINQYNVNALQTTPSRLTQLLEEDADTIENLKVLLVGGEALSQSSYTYLKELKLTKVINVYGPTETTIWSSSSYLQTSTFLSIGNPLLNESIYIVSNSAQCLMPIGAVGEICIGGAGLARGYLNQPELTKEKFMSNPFKPGEKMYKTGDLGRWLPDGNIEYIGRIDEQVKIRGYRIELGEIEAVLKKYPSINTAVVIAKANAAGEKELVAYIASKEELNTAEICNYLSKSLPEYMLPSHFVRLEKIPLTTNGKLDRKALPNPATFGLPSGVQYVAPTTAIEEKLVKLWQEILGRERIGINDNFFALGGHSLKATRLASQIHKIFDVEITIAMIFEKPLLEAQAKIIEQAQKTRFANIPIAVKRDCYPLSSSQRRLWVISQFEEASIAYNIPGVYVFEGRLDKAALEESFTTLIEHHEILRTVIKEDESGEVKQWILSVEELGFRLRYKDFRQQTKGTESIKQIIEEEFTKVFNLANGPLLRASLYQIENNKWIFSYVIHHIISDGWSMEVLIKELLMLYNAYSKGGANPLEPLGIQYKDYAVWQQEQLSGGALQQHRAYWLNQFEGEVPVLELPIDKPRPVIKTYNGATLQKTFDASLTKRLKMITQEQGATLFMGLLAVVNALFYKYTNQEDIIIGSPIAGREHVDLENQIGFYVNTLALRTRFKGEDSYIDVLDNVKQITLDAYQHQIYPFDELVDALELSRDMSRSALFDVMVVLQNTERQELEGLNLGEIKVKEYEGSENPISKFDLTFTFIEITEALQLTIEYNSDIYNKATIEGLARHFNQLLITLVDQPTTPLEQLEYLSEAEKHQLLVEFNDTAAAYPKDKTVVDLFEEQVEETPDNIAVVFEDRELSYSDLNAKANRLADYLRKSYDIKPDDLIGIQLERSEWMIIAILGVLKSGGAYVPVDPEYPQERIDYMMADSKCKTVINEGELRRFKKEENKYNKQNLALINKSEDLAYVIYTSGTSGKPKGVMVEHRNVVSFFENFGSKFGLKPDIILGCTTNYTFDISVLEILGSLAQGLTIFLMSTADPLAVLFYIASKKVNALQITPSRLNQLLLIDPNAINKLGSLEVLLIGGEVLDERNYVYLKKLTMTKVIHVYGPTETTIWSSCLQISKSTLLSIGAPLLNENIYITDNHQQLRPIGVIGEICISGGGVARGYLNREELTQEKFVPNPFKPGTKLYKTGDIGRWLADGNIEYIGRKDEQVKIRGYRIELGEIEHALQKYEAIDAAVVIAKSNQQNEKELVAYIVGQKIINATDIKIYLSKILPSYMLPNHYVLLDALPLTSNGKVDKKKLSNPENTLLSNAVAYIAPKTDTEKQLSLLWQEILGVEKIGLQDDFFMLGGQSLKATRLISQIYKQFNVTINLKDVFTKTILQEQAVLIQQSATTMYSRIELAAPQKSYPLSSSQLRLWVLSQLEESNMAYNLPGVYVFTGELNLSALQYAFHAIIERHEILRTIFIEDEANNVQQVIQPVREITSTIAYQDIRSQTNREQVVKDLVYNDCMHPFNLSIGPLLRASLYQIENNKWIFSYVIHHIISDGWSMEVLIKELLMLYNAYSKGGANPLEPLGIQYKDYAVWQQEQLSGGALQQHRAYWLNQFEGEIPVLELPIDKPRPVIKTYNGATLQKTFDASLTKRLKMITQEQGATLFMGLLAVVNALFYKYTNQEDIIIGSPIAGREHVDLENQIGFYVNTLALRTRFKGEDSYIDVLDNVKQITLDAYQHQIYPFDELVDALELSRDMSRSALFDVMVVLQNTATHHTLKENQINDIVVTAYQEETALTSKFDITFNFIEIEEKLYLDIEYNTDLYHRTTIDKMANHVKQLFNNIVADATKPIYQLNILTDQEKQQLLVAFNHTISAYPNDKTLVELLEEQITKASDKIVLAFEEKTYTYQQLNEQSNRLAGYLRKHYAIKPDDLVGIQLERSERMIISILGILKSGAAYVPIDPEYPQERIDYMIEDSKCKVVIDEKELQRFKREENTYSKENVSHITRPNNLAYVMYTSGSTGQPKGCMLEHRGIINRIAWMYDHYKFTLSDVILQKTTYTFDVSVWEILLPLCFGAKMVLCKREDIGSPERIAHLIVKYKVSCLHFVPSMLNAFIGSVWEDEKLLSCLQSVNKVMTSGEALSIETVKRWHEKVNVPLYNLYGPTEASIDVTHYTTSQDDRIIPIGRPIWNTQIYIVDKHYQLLPIGAVGEICIAGDGLARGYLNKPELTKEKFIGNPFKAGTKIYKTGDVGRWLADGNIEYIGRKDEQVKIRGYRIELGEIEHALQKHEAIDAAVVTTKSNQQQEKELVAYIVSKQALNTTEIRNYLSGSIPVYMLPSHYIQLEQIPLSANGKIDKKALPNPETLGLSSGVAYIAPTNEIEKHLVTVYEEVLKKRPIGISEDFFALGGDSIKSIQVVSRLKQRGYSLTIRDMMTYPIIQNLATKVQIDTRYINQNIVEGLIPLSPIQQYFFENHTIDTHHYNQSVLMQSNTTVSEQALKAALDKLVLHHDALRTIYKKNNEGWIQENKGKEQTYSLEIIDNINDDSFETHCNRIQSSINLETGPLFKAALFRNTQQQDQLLLVCHHLIIDGVSWRILLEDLSTLYQQYIAGEVLTLPLKTDSFQYWQQQQIEYANSKVLQQEEAYWSSVASSKINRLPKDNAQGSNSVKDTTVADFMLDENLTQQLLTQCYKAYQTDINDLLLSALSLALRETFDLQITAINFEGHGREHIGSQVDVSRTIGWFTSLYPVIIDTRYSEDVIRHVIEVKETLHRIPNKGIGYGILKYLAQKSYSIMPEIIFNYLGDFGGSLHNQQGEPLFTFSEKEHGQDMSEKMQRDYVLDISGMIIDKKMQLSISYSNQQYTQVTMERLVESYQQQLQNIIQQLSAQDKTYLTPVDLTYKELTLEQVQELNRNDSLEEVYLLTPLQQGLYYHWLTMLNSLAYFNQMSYRLKGHINIQLLQRSFQTLIARHAVLRTYFTQELSDKILQVVQKQSEAKFNYINVAKEKSFTIETYKQQDKVKSFDLQSGSQMRLSVLDLGNDTYEFIWSFHHILMDGWCISILIKEFFEIYESLLHNKEPQLPRVYSYSTYIKWLAGIDKTQSLQYWKNYLNGYNTRSSLPKAPSNADSSYVAQEATLTIAGDIRTSIKMHCIELSITENTFIQTVWGILLSKYNDCNDVVFGSVVSGRPAELEGIEEMIGLFINTIPVRIQTNDDICVSELLKQIQKASNEGIKHHYTQLAEIQSESELGRDLFDHIMVFENYPIQEMVELSVSTKKDAKFSILSSDMFEQTDYDLTITIHHDEKNIYIRFNYNGNLYEQAQIQRVQQHFLNIITTILENPQQYITQIGYLSKTEKQQLLFEFNNTIVDYPKDRTIVDLFEEQVNKTPNKVAIIFRERKLTYKELNEKSNQLANYLRINYDIEPNDLIGIQLEKTEWMIISMLAVLKAGAAYVPIDLEYPMERINYMVADSNSKVVIDEKELTKYRLEENKFDKTNLLHINKPTDLVYVIYTSGSTGQPKGVLISHKSLYYFLEYVKRYSIEIEFIVQPFIASNAFDISLFHLFAPLLSGGTSIIVNKDQLQDIHQFIIILEQVNIIDTVPAMYHLLANHILEYNLSNNFKHIQQIFIGGDSVPDSLLYKLSKIFSSATITIIYGPTESTVFCTQVAYKAGTIKPESKGSIIGRPITNTSIYILNQQYALASIGVIGEICIGGAGLAQGYLNNTELTEEKFVPNPFKPDERIYRTGDLGRWLPDGNIEFFGRKDSQTKVRGFRIELEEIEKNLEKHENINRAIVLPRKDIDGNNCLVAYIEKRKRVKLHPSTAEYFVYDDLLYYALTTNEKRNDHYKRVFNKLLKDKIVLDLGTGADVILSQFCIEAGAQKVYAVEILKETYDKAKKCIERLGLENKIILIHGDVMQIELPEKVDYCVSEIVGSIGGSEGAAKLINSTRRLLKDPTNMLPKRSLTKIAAVYLPDELHQYAFDEMGNHYIQRIFDKVGYKFDMRICVEHLPIENVISDYQTFEDLDFTESIKLEDEHAIKLTFNKESIVNGFIVWLNLYIDEIEIIDTLSERYNWLPIYFPVFYNNVKVEPGDYIKAKIERKLADNTLNPDFTISGTLYRKNNISIDFTFKSSNHEKQYRSTPFYQTLFENDTIKIKKDISENTLKNYLENILPSYMVPSYFIELDAIPLTPNGKINKTKLLDIEISNLSNGAEYIAPSNEIEEKLVGIWQEILGKEKIGVKDNFFEIGGHSLKAARLVNIIYKYFNVKIELKDVFLEPTIENLSDTINNYLWMKDSSEENFNDEIEI